MPTLSQQHATLSLRIGGMSCVACEGRIHGALAGVPGFFSAEVDHRDGRAAITYDPAVAVGMDFAAAIVAAGYAATTSPNPGAPGLPAPTFDAPCPEPSGTEGQVPGRADASFVAAGE
ncbi:MAG TPA: heavy metal-associated domain-containing protein [Gemmatimonadales bacterium]|nr:heavy metal-associated domain-containing protein [Gemmatimonadales bacterium]